MVGNLDFLLAACVAAAIVAVVIVKRRRASKTERRVEMPQGLQIWDENGTLTLDTTSRTGRLLGSVSFSGNGSIDDPRLLSGAPFFFAQYHFSPRYGSDLPPAIEVNFNGTTMSWQLRLGGGSSSPGIIFYGVF